MAGKNAVWYYDKVKVTGLNDTKRFLRETGRKSSDLKPAYAEVSEYAADLAKSALPSKKGRLRASVKAAPTARLARIRMGGRDAPHMFLQELGGGARWHSRIGVSAARRQGQRGRMASQYGYRPVPINGAIRMQAKKYIFVKPHKPPASDMGGGYFVQPALRAHADDIAGRFLDSLIKTIAGFGR